MSSGLTLGGVGSFVSLGRVHLPVYGLYVALGLMASAALGLRTARLARVEHDAFWDLGLVAVLAALGLSRIMLLAENLHLFLHFPMASLELPPLSFGGVLLTLIVAFWYMRRRRLPWLGVLEAASPCLALLLCFVSLGAFASGTREGIPTDVPWAVGSSFGRVHPVELYMAVAWLLVCTALVGVLRLGPPRGETLGWAMVFFGIVFASTDFFHLPGLLYGSERLDRIQWRGIELIVLGSLVLAWRMAGSSKTPAPAPEVHSAI